MTPLFRELSVLHNFTIETQVQYHAPLAFSPHENELENGSKEYRLDQDHLKTFVNSAEWSLGTIFYSQLHLMDALIYLLYSV